MYKGPGTAKKVARVALARRRGEKEKPNRQELVHSGP